MEYGILMGYVAGVAVVLDNVRTNISIFIGVQWEFNRILMNMNGILKKAIKWSQQVI